MAVTRPSEKRVALLNAIGDLHTEWVQEVADRAGFKPRRGGKSDYNVHHVDLDAPVEDLDDFDTRVQALLDEGVARAGGEWWRLHKYWTQGEGLARWANDPHPFKALLAFLMLHMPETKARKTAADWFREVKGFLPTGHPPGHSDREAVDPVTLREQRERDRRNQRKRRARRSDDLDDTDIERANELKEYWLRGEGAARWSRWTQLYNHLRKHLSDERARRTAAEWFHERYGYWPGHQKGSNPTGPG